MLVQCELFFKALLLEFNSLSYLLSGPNTLLYYLGPLSSWERSPVPVSLSLSQSASPSLPPAKWQGGDNRMLFERRLGRPFL